MRERPNLSQLPDAAPRWSAPGSTSGGCRAGFRTGRTKRGCERGLTWIKPSFLWMMYRSGWSRKEGQERVLAIEISRAGFDWALARACLSAYHPGVHADRDAWRAALRGSPARVQWDPERDWRLQALSYRALQLGLSGEAVRRYAEEWLVSVSDVTGLAHAVHARVRAGDEAGARELLPEEVPYVPAGGVAGLTAH
ncbi:DUF4291 domain-containing protein [Streptomyces albidoflavus]